LKFITTFHHQWLWGWYPTFNDSLDVGKPQYAGLYGPVISRAAWQHQETAEKPDAAFAKVWQAKVNEVTKKYHPDLLYFDSRLGHIQENYRKQVVSDFRKKSKARKKNGVVLYKGTDLPEGVGVRTHEKSRMNEVGARPWLTEETVSTYSWCYTQDMVLRPTADILHGLIDIVSKNGVYLLNISPKADGTIPADQKEILLQIGAWLNECGEAIYGTRPWYTYGEGPRKEAAETEEGQQKKFYELKYTAADVRYTVKDNTIYALFLGRPAENQPVLLKSFAKAVVPGNLGITRVKMVGTNKEVAWQLQNDGLTLRMPEQVPERMATVIKIETTGKL
jgi:alpha-L-fucosidase